MPTPYERASVRAYLRAWLRRAWDDTWEFERRWGLRIGPIAALLTAIAAGALEGPDVNPLVVALAAFASVLGVWLIAYVTAWMLAPAWIDIEREAQAEGSDNSRDLLQSLDVGASRNGPLIVSFPTRGQKDRLIVLEPPYGEEGWPITALRFLEPRKRIVRAMDPLPVVLRISLLGRLVIKQIGLNGLLVDEDRSRGRMIRAEVYRQPSRPL